MNRRKEAERDLRAGDRLRGVLEHLLKQLREEHSCKEDAIDKRLEQLEQKTAAAKAVEESEWQEYRKAVICGSGDGEAEG